ncbi:hypothetical protein JQC91_15210 [Jannaschia sp. Os4]|uniref:DUF2268 domain-containing putative Zn-dependent protease n=1 Tax=Jannaschia sp. Os4 TaxID=2807617 RepID=UPI0019397387|nr:DUF2268 domain-containing putative Zn-dependent protease [Jannaschia sp. Os4]MBM2577654.1 hypothetical protein [Jannaschia sp. Os4]
MWTVERVSPTLRPHLPAIEAAIAATRARVAAVADPVPIRFLLVADRSRALPMHGFGGYCGDPDVIRLSFDPKNPNMVPNLGATLERAIAHEYHHALRAAAPGYGAKLGSALVAEGLAGHFVRMLHRSPPEPWEAALGPEELDPWRAPALERFDRTGHGHARWFFGADGHPRWLGYALGYDLVGRHLRRHPDETPLTLAHAPHMAFRDAVRRGPGSEG